MEQNVGHEKQVNDLTVSEFKMLISETIRETLEDIVENKEALASPIFLNAIKEAREEYKSGKTKNLEELFDV